VVSLFSKILKVFAKNNLFDEGVELIGSWCFYLYQKNLGAPSFPFRTQDIDFLIPNPFKGKEHKDFIQQLEGLGFQTEFTRNGSLFLWNAELRIEFITPEKGKGSDAAIRIKKLGLSAIPLRFVNLLLDDPVHVTEGGVKIALPNPSNYCLHKLIIANRRKSKDKLFKDIQQAICTYSIADKNYLQKQFLDFPKKWKQSIVDVLAKNKDQFPLFDRKIGEILITLQNY
jgi:hypothetical protein